MSLLLQHFAKALNDNALRRELETGPNVRNVETSRGVTGYVVGVDLAQTQDYTAIAVSERTEVVEQRFTPCPRTGSELDLGTRRIIHHAIRWLDRPPRGTPYQVIARHVCDLLADLPAMPRRPILAVDATGVGRPVVEMMRPYGLRPMAITITGGVDENSPAPDDHRVPKRILASLMQATMQSGRLTIAKGLPLTEPLAEELRNFRVRITAAGNETFEAWREAVHDDLVLATAIAVWAGERQEPGARPVPFSIGR